MKGSREVEREKLWGIVTSSLEARFTTRCFGGEEGEISFEESMDSVRRPS
jgi:hypothetical protein